MSPMVASMVPISSLPVLSTSRLRSPSAMDAATDTAEDRGRVIIRDSHQPTSRARIMAEPTPA
ncbi:hypothetical protein [Pseudodesulfovibrio indicus]|uniref:hypothetical protein n=1 Tax=Pseudodesulfovibrio indicus TaxID=1716143 RepID=UPI00292DF5E2|nr:hypothetical protein [Pseudodesulfovibrio indicus]